MNGEATLNKDEEEVMDDLLTVMNRIQDWGLTTNSQELGQAVHVVQGFIIQHMLQRINPEAWGEWYKPLDKKATG